MKYEAVFGDQGLFDGAPDGAEMVGGLSDKCRLFYKIVGGDLYASFGKHDDFTRELTTKAKDIKVAAMRRIIQEPKRWTAEDQKDGRLPDVGAELLHESEGYVNFVGEFDFRWMLRTKEGGLYLAEKFYCSPIETPEEKAKRLRSEWCSECTSKYYPRGHKGFPEMIYDALLSGALSVPTKGGE